MFIWNTKLKILQLDYILILYFKKIYIYIYIMYLIFQNVSAIIASINSKLN